MAKPTRTVEEINRDYFQTAAILGDLVWKISKFTGEDTVSWNNSSQIGDLQRKLKTIDNEMDEIQKQQAKKTNGAAMTPTFSTATPETPTEAPVQQ